VTEVLTLEGADGLRLRADRFDSPGRRGTVVLLHGGGQNRHSWSEVAVRVAAAGWDAVTIDARGHGESDWAPNGDYSPDAMVRDLRAILPTLDVRPVLVGASMGGLVALQAVGADPAIARGIVLADIVPDPEPAGIARVLGFMRDHADGFTSLEEARAAIQAYDATEGRAPSDGRVDRVERQLRRDGDRWRWHWDPAILGAADGLAAPEQRARWAHAVRSLRIPCLLVRGRRSDVVSEDGVERVLRQSDVVRCVEVDGGHRVSGQDNDAFAQVLVGFLDELVVRGEL
jgi:pimeloyl-ACP methyl ester carboxylesterase